MNPFIVMGKIPEDKFCDRVHETEKLTQQIVGQSTNVLLMSERRIGKTGLIDHCYNQPEIANYFYTFYFDILHTSCFQEFVYEFGKEVYSQLIPQGQKIIQSLTMAIRSISPKFSFDPLTGVPTFALEFGSITEPEYTLDEILAWLEHADKPCMIAIDEFQRIGKYPEKNIEALLRSKIQHLSNCHFIFSGSEQHLLSEMFQAHNRPFYNSTTIMSLGAIDITPYREFAQYWFAQDGKQIDEKTFDDLYNAFDGNTFCVQKVLHMAYDAISSDEVCDKSIIQGCFRDILWENSHGYKEILSRMTSKQKAVLIAIASEGKATKVTSGAFLRKHKLESASMVQTALRYLLEAEWVSVREQTYRVSDPFFSMWLRQL